MAGKRRYRLIDANLRNALFKALLALSQIKWKLVLEPKWKI